MVVPGFYVGVRDLGCSWLCSKHFTYISLAGVVAHSLDYLPSVHEALV